MTRSKLWRLVAALLAFTLLAAACGSDDAQDTSTPASETDEGGGGGSDLAAACPEQLVLQKDWLAETEHAAFYQLIGDAGTGSEGKFEGPIGDTGVNLVILEGGGGLGMGDGEAPFSSLYTGNSKADLTPDLAYVGTDDAIIFSEQFPVVAVVTPLDKDPQILFWDPSIYPDGFGSVDDLAAFAEGGEGKIYIGNASRSYGKYLVDSGVPTDVFVEGYAGDSENFVTNGGQWLNQGYASNEVWDFENGRQWEKPVEYVYVADLGWDKYPSAVSVAANRLDELTPCLEVFVPMVQQAQIDYINSPGTVNQVLADFNDAGYGAGFWKTPLGLNEAGAEVMLADGLVGNGDYTPDTLGDFDPDRIQTMIDIIAPDLDDRAKEGVTADDVFTNQFIDSSIGL
ncbi:MAG: hypothetical protein V3V01_05480 [Acidimicrobiales bacterium]